MTKYLDDDETIFNFQKSVIHYFSESDGSKIEKYIPYAISKDKISISGVLYDELIGNRAFMIYVGDNNDIPLNAFVKFTGWDYENELFGISVSIKNDLIKYIWILYVGWMRDGRSGEDLLYLVDKWNSVRHE